MSEFQMGPLPRKQQKILKGKEKKGATKIKQVATPSRPIKSSMEKTVSVFNPSAKKKSGTKQEVAVCKKAANLAENQSSTV